MVWWLLNVLAKKYIMSYLPFQRNLFKVSVTSQPLWKQYSKQQLFAFVLVSDEGTGISGMVTGWTKAQNHQSSWI